MESLKEKIDFIKEQAERQIKFNFKYEDYNEIQDIFKYFEKTSEENDIIYLVGEINAYLG